jgi:negative regulator of sigma E activity
MTDTTPPVPPAPASVPPGGDDDRWMLSAYLDDELSEPERATLEARLVGSADWRAELDEVRTARDAVRALGTRDAPEGFWLAVEAAVAAAPIHPADGRADTSPLPTIAARRGVVALARAERRRPRRRLAAWAAGGVAAALVLGAMFVIPGRRQVKPNVVAVVTRHGAASADRGDPISGLVPLAPMQSSR